MLSVCTREKSDGKMEIKDTRKYVFHCNQYFEGSRFDDIIES